MQFALGLLHFGSVMLIVGASVFVVAAAAWGVAGSTGLGDATVAPFSTETSYKSASKDPLSSSVAAAISMTTMMTTGALPVSVLAMGLMVVLASHPVAATMPPGLYDSCIASRNSNLSLALALNSSDTFFTMYNLADRTQCAGKVPHPVNPAFQALGWVPCTSSAAVKVRYNATKAAPSLASGTKFTTLRFQVSRVRGPLTQGISPWYLLSAFQFYYLGSVVPFQSAKIYPGVQGQDCPGNTTGSITTNNVSSCANLCASTSGCVGYTVKYLAAGVPTCTLKTSLVTCGTPLPNGVAGGYYALGASPGSGLLTNYDCANNDLTGAWFKASSVAECSAMCASTARCAGFSYFPNYLGSNSNTCFPKYSVVQGASTNGAQCYTMSPVVDVTGVLHLAAYSSLAPSTTAYPMENPYPSSPIEFTFAAPVAIDSYSFATGSSLLNTATASLHDPVVFDMLYSVDNGNTWQSLGRESNANNIPTSRGALAGPFYFQATTSLLPPPLAAQNFSTGKVGQVISSPLANVITPYRYYRWLPLSSQGSQITFYGNTPSTTCNGLASQSLPYVYCVSVSELQFFFQGNFLAPVNMTISSTASQPTVASVPAWAYNPWQLLMDSDLTTSISMAVAPNKQYGHSSAYAAPGTFVNQYPNQNAVALGANVVVDFGSAVVVDSYKVGMGPQQATNPASWALEGSNDQSSWTSVHVVADEIDTIVAGIPVYIGCYADLIYNSERVMPYNVFGSAGNSGYVSVEICQQYAAAGGYKYFSLQDGNQCFVSNNLVLAVSGGTSSACTSTCSGNTNQICGGPSANSLYYTNAAVLLNSLPTPNSLTYTRYPLNQQFTWHNPVPSSGNCYADLSACAGQRTLSNSLYTGNSANTIELCASNAVSRGFPFFSVQFGQECYGEQNFFSRDCGTSSACTMTCAGNSNEICGGTNANSVYLTNIYSTNPPAPVTVPIYLGCWTYPATGSSWTLLSSSIASIEACNTLANQNGFLFMLISAGTNCYGNNDVTGVASNGVGVCNTVCSGNGNEYCGGPNGMAVYATKNIAPIYQGCMHVTSSSAFPTQIYANIAYVSPMLCAATAVQYGYSTYLVVDGWACMFGNAATLSSAIQQNAVLRASESQCLQAICYGDATQFCGGKYNSGNDYYAAVYSVIPFGTSAINPTVTSGSLDLWPGSYYTYNAQSASVGNTSVNSLTAAISIPFSTPAASYLAPWYTMELSSGEIVVAAYYRGFGAINACTQSCSTACKVHPAGLNSDGLVVFGLVNNTMLLNSQYGPDSSIYNAIAPPTSAPTPLVGTNSPTLLPTTSNPSGSPITSQPSASPVAQNSGSVSCSIALGFPYPYDGLTPQVFVNGTNITQFVTLSNVIPTGVLYTVSFGATSAASRFTVLVGGPFGNITTTFFSKCTAATCGVAVQCFSAGVPGWNFQTSTANNQWSVIPSNSASSLSFNADVVSLNPSNVAGSNLSLANTAYLGCWASVSGTLSKVLSTSASMTVETCAAVAQAQGLLYFALFNGNQCLGGNDWTSGSSNGVGTCNVACLGNSTEICGSSTAKSVYATAINLLPAYQGCFTSTNGLSPLPTQIGSGNPNVGALMTCAALARQNGYSVFGIMYGTVCLAGNNLQYVTGRLSPDSKCNNSCLSDGTSTSGFTCGSPYTGTNFLHDYISVYTVPMYPTIIASSMTNGPQALLGSAVSIWSSWTASAFTAFTTPVNQVLCHINAQGGVSRVYVDGKDVTSSLAPLQFLSNPALDKTFSFAAPTLASRITIIANSGPFLANPASASGLVMSCTHLSSPSSPWNIGTSASGTWRVIPGSSKASPLNSLEPWGANVDCSGNDLVGITVSSLDACAALCLTYSACAGFEYFTVVTVQAHNCYVKYAMVQSSAVAGALCYARTTPLYLVEPWGANADCGGNDLNSGVTVTNVDACGVACLSNPSCVGFEYFTVVTTQAHNCYIKSAMVQSGTYAGVLCVALANRPLAIVQSTSNVLGNFSSDIGSLNPSGQSSSVVAGSSYLSDAYVSNGASAIWSIFDSQYQAFTLAVAGSSNPSPGGVVDFDQVYFSRLVRPLGALDTTPPSAYPTPSPLLASSNVNLSPFRVLWYMGLDPMSGVTVTRSPALSGTCPGTPFQLIASTKNIYLEWSQAYSGSASIVPLMSSGTDFSQTTALATVGANGPYRFFGDYLCGCDTHYPLVTTNLGTAYCPAVDECPYDPVSDPYGVNTATCGNGDYTYVKCIDNGPFTYGYQCECVTGASYQQNNIQLFRQFGDLNPQTVVGNESISCRPLQIRALVSNIGINVAQNLSFNTTLSITYYDAALISEHTAVDVSTSLDWSSQALNLSTTLLYKPCLTYISQVGSAYSDCLVKYISDVVFRVKVTNQTDFSINGDFYDVRFTMPCGCTTLWLPPTAINRPDDGRPKAFTATQTFGQTLFSWVDDSYCATKFKFTRAIYNSALGSYSKQLAFVPNYEVSHGSSGSSKCLGDSYDLVAPVAQSLSDRLLDYPDTFPPGQLLQYCITAAADETVNKPKYTSAQVCTTMSVNFEARFRVYVGRLDQSPVWDSSGGVLVTYTVYDPASNQTNFIPLFTATNTTAKDGYIIIKLNMSSLDYPSVAGVENLQLGFTFSKTSYYADTDTYVEHTFLCNNGRSQCNPSYPNLLVVPHLSFDSVSLSITDNTYSLFSGYVGIDSLQQPPALPVAPNFWNCPQANVQLTFKEFPGGSSDTLYGTATTDATGYFQIELPIGATVLITTMQLLIPSSSSSSLVSGSTSSTTNKASTRAHQFVLASDRSNYSATPYRILGNALSGIYFLDVTTETLFVDIAGGACNTTLATSAFAVLTRNNEFCIPPALSPTKFGSVSSSGWPFALAPIVNEYYSLDYGTGVRFWATVPAAQFEVVVYVNGTLDGSLSSAASVSDYFFNYRYPQDTKPVVDFRDLPQLQSGYFPTNSTTTLVTQAPSAFQVFAPQTPTASPVANSTLPAIFAARNTTENFESQRLVRFQYDSKPQVNVSFWQAGNRVDLPSQTCNLVTAILYNQITVYLNTSEYGTTTPVTAYFTVSQPFFAGLTCSYLPGASLIINNQLQVSSSDPNCVTDPCTVPLSHVYNNLTDPVTGAVIPMATQAYYNHTFYAVPTSLAPFSNEFAFVYQGLQYPPPPYPNLGTVYQVFVLGHTDSASAGTKPVTLVRRTPLAVIYQPPGSLSTARYEKVSSIVTLTSNNMDTYTGLAGTFDFTAMFGAATDLCVGPAAIVAALSCVNFKAGAESGVHIRDLPKGHTDSSGGSTEVSKTITWSVATNGDLFNANNLKGAGRGSDGDVFVLFVDVWAVLEVDTIMLGTGDSCLAQIDRQFVITEVPNSSRYGFLSRQTLNNQILPTLYQLQYSGSSQTSGTLEQITASISFVNALLARVPLSPSANAGLQASSGLPIANVTNVAHLSFAGGAAAISYSLSTDSLIGVSSGTTEIRDLTIDASGGPYTDFRAGLLFHLSVDGGVSYQHTVTTVSTTETKYDESSSVSFTLLDGDSSDYFNVDVFIDSQYGTFYFSTLSGQSRCPHEDGTQYVERPGMFISDQVSKDISPGNAATYTVWIENLGNSDVNTTQGTTSTLVLSMDMKNFQDGVTVLVDGQAMSYAGIAFSNVAQQSKFPVTVQLIQGSKFQAYSLALYLNTECGFAAGSTSDRVSVQLTANFLSSCPSIILGGVFGTQSTLSLLAGGGSTVELVFQNLGVESTSGVVTPWIKTSNVKAVNVEWSFEGTNEWNTLVDAFGRAVDLRTVENPTTNYAAIQWDLAPLGLKSASILIGGVVHCTVPSSANPLDSSLASSYSLLGEIIVDLVQPYVVGFDPRSQISPGDVLQVTFNEPVNCAGPSFAVNLVQPPGPVVPAFGGISSAAGNVVIKCTENTVAVSLKPGALSLLDMAGEVWYLLLTNVQDVAGNAVVSNIPKTSPWYLYAKDGNVEVALKFSTLDTVSTRFSITGLTLIGLKDPTHHGTFVVGDSNWLNVVAQIQQTVGGNVGIDPARIDVQYFWFSAGFAPICTCNLIVNPGSPSVVGENLVNAFAAAYPALFNSHGAQYMDLLPMSEEDKIKLELDAVNAKLDIVQTQLKVLLSNLVPNYTPSPLTTSAPAPSFKPTPYPTYRPVPKPTDRPSQRPTSHVPTPRPTRYPSAFPSNAPTTPTAMPSSSPSSSGPTNSPVFQPTSRPTRNGQTHRPSASPTSMPTSSPSRSQPSASPSASPSSMPSDSPINSPSQAPSSSVPSTSPVFEYPSASPTLKPTTLKPLSSKPTSSTSPTSAKPTTTTKPTSATPTSSRPSTRSPSSSKPTTRAPVSG